MTEDQVYGHFVYQSGNHGSVYVNKDAIIPHVDMVSLLCAEMAAKVANPEIEVVVAPATGGIALSQWLAHHLTQASWALNAMRSERGRVQRPPVLAVYAEKDGDGGFVFKRGYGKLVADRPCVVVEDIFTRGGSAKAVVDLVRRTGGSVSQVVGFWNRGGITATTLGVDDFSPLISRRLPEYRVDVAEGLNECPVCLAGEIPVNTELGHGRAYLAKLAS